MNLSSPHDFFPKEIAKIYATSKVDAESLETKLGRAGIAGDVLQFASDITLKTYCGNSAITKITLNYSLSHTANQKRKKLFLALKAAITYRNKWISNDRGKNGFCR